MESEEKFDIGNCSAIVLGRNVKEKLLYKKISSDLASAIYELFKVYPEIVDDSSFNLTPNAILIGRPEINMVTNALLQSASIELPKEFSPESYYIKPIQIDGRSMLLIVGYDARGDMYGVYWLIGQIKAGKFEKLLKGVFRKPVFKKRLTYGDTALFPLDQVAPGWEDPYWQCQLDKPYYPYVDEVKFKEGVERFKRLCDIIARCGYNGLIVGDVIHLVTFDELGIYPKDSPLYIRHKKYQKFFKEMIKYAKDLDLEFYIRSDEIVYTKPMEEYAGVICPGNPKFWELYKIKYSELFDTFPEIDGVLHRLGEVYIYEPYRGVEITKYPYSPLTRHTCSMCEGMSFEEKIRALIRNTLEITHKYNKTYIHRTWGYPTDKPDVYLEIIKGFENERDFICEMKFMAGDWWWTNPLNPVIGIGEVEQMISFISKRQMEGHGIFPTYAGELYKRALKFASSTKVARNIWVWIQESGWSVPNLSEIVFFKGFTHWSQLNFYATGRLAWDPDEDVFEIAYDWAAQEYSEKAAENVAKIAMLSKDIVEKAFYIQDFAKLNERYNASLPIRNGTTIVSDDNILRQIYEACKNNIEGSIQDAIEAVQLCERMIEIFKEVEPYVKDKDLYDLTMYSLEHMKAFVTLLRWYREAFLRTYRILDLDPDSRAKELPICKRAVQNLIKAKDDYDKRFGIAYTYNIFEFLRSKIVRRYILPSIC